MSDCKCAAHQCGKCICPHCQSPDTARYRWPDDYASQWYVLNTPSAMQARICLDCRRVYQP